MVNLYQIEPLNTVEFVMKDMPLEIRREAEKNGKKSAARMLLRTIFAYLIAAFVLNRLTDELYGGTPAPLDIAGLTANFFASGKGLSTNDYMRKLINKVVGSEIFDVPEERETFDTLAAIKDTGYNLINEIPFASNVSGLFGVGDRTMPFPNIFGTWRRGWSSLQSLYRAADRPRKPDTALRQSRRVEKPRATEKSRGCNIRWIWTTR